MGMFLNYQNISNNYIPNNLINAFPQNNYDSKLDPLETSKPFEEYNINGELVGYFWRQGETVNLEFNIEGEITVESDAIILKTSGQSPINATVGKINQRCYNIVDFKSWTCVGIDSSGSPLWNEDTEFTYPQLSNRSLYVSAADYLKDKNVEIVIYDFRMEPICRKTYPASSRIVFTLDKEQSRKIPKGIYYCSLSVFNKDVFFTIFDSNDCSLIVK